MSEHKKYMNNVKAAEVDEALYGDSINATITILEDQLDYLDKLFVKQGNQFTPEQTIKRDNIIVSYNNTLKLLKKDE